MRWEGKELFRKVLTGRCGNVQPYSAPSLAPIVIPGTVGGSCPASGFSAASLKSCHLSGSHPQVPVWGSATRFLCSGKWIQPWRALGIQLLEFDGDYLRTAWAFWDTQISTNFQQVAGVCGSMGSILSRRRNSRCQRKSEASGPQSRLWIFTLSWTEAESCANLTTFWSKVVETGMVKLSLTATLINC